MAGSHRGSPFFLACEAPSSGLKLLTPISKGPLTSTPFTPFFWCAGWLNLQEIHYIENDWRISKIWRLNYYDYIFNDILLWLYMNIFLWLYCRLSWCLIWSRPTWIIVFHRYWPTGRRNSTFVEQIPDWFIVCVDWKILHKILDEQATRNDEQTFDPPLNRLYFDRRRSLVCKGLMMVMIWPRSD